jgi:hypothetical protein
VIAYVDHGKTTLRSTHRVRWDGRATADAEATLMLGLLAPRARLRVVGLAYSTLKQITAALFLGVAMFLFIRFTNIPFDPALDPLKPHGSSRRCSRGVRIGVYLLAAWAIRIGELKEVIAVVRARLRAAAHSRPWRVSGSLSGVRTADRYANVPCLCRRCRSKTRLAG